MSVPVYIKNKILSIDISQKLDRSFITGVLCAVIFLLVNPFLAIFIVALISFTSNIPKWPFIIFAAIGFALFFYNRDYGVTWADSSDDVPNYILYFHSDDSLSITDIFTRFFLFPSGTEPLWHMWCWTLINVFHAGDNTFIFTYYLLLFVCLFTCFVLMSEKYFTLFAIVYIFLTPASLDALFHIWRQELALLVYLMGISLYFVKNKKAGLLLVYISPFIHLSFLYFAILFLVYCIFKNKKITSTKGRYMSFLGIVSILVSLFYLTGIAFLGSAGVSAIGDYFSGTGDSMIRMFIVVTINSVLLLSSFFLLKTDSLNSFFLMVFFPILTIMFFFPGSNAIYTRLFIAVLPLLGISFFRSYLMNFSKRLLPILIIFIFLTGSLRIYLALNVSCTQFLAHGHLFDPAMGILKCLQNI